MTGPGPVTHDFAWSGAKIVGGRANPHSRARPPAHDTGTKAFTRLPCAFNTYSLTSTIIQCTLSISTYDMGAGMPRIAVDDNRRMNLRIRPEQKATLMRAAALKNTDL